MTFRFTGYPDRYKPAFVRMVHLAGKSRTNSREESTSLGIDVSLFSSPAIQQHVCDMHAVHKNETE